MLHLAQALYYRGVSCGKLEWYILARQDLEVSQHIWIACRLPFTVVWQMNESVMAWFGHPHLSCVHLTVFHLLAAQGALSGCPAKSVPAIKDAFTSIQALRLRWVPPDRS
jgi:hypothetical protein